MAIVVTIKDHNGDPVSGLKLQVLTEDQRSHVGWIGPSDEEGLCFASIAQGTYYLSLVVSVLYTGNEQLIEIDTDEYLEFTYNLLSTSTEDPNYSDLLAKIDNATVKLALLATKQKELLTKTEVTNLKSYFNNLKSEVDQKSVESENRYRTLQENITSIMDQYSKRYWEDPVDTEDDLPDTDGLYTIRVVIEPNVGSIPALFIKEAEFWTRIT